MVTTATTTNLAAGYGGFGRVKNTKKRAGRISCGTGSQGCGLLLLSHTWARRIPREFFHTCDIIGTMGVIVLTWWRSIQTWALEEARRRLEKEGILEDPFPEGASTTRILEEEPKE
jgi:hypothetical protein